MRKLTQNQQLQRWHDRVQKMADKSLRTGKISRREYRDILRAALDTMKPRDTVEVVGWK